MADEGRLRQILFNLAGNAVKFTEGGGVLIRVDPVKAAKGRGGSQRVRLRFSVRDSGPGVPEEARERIFEDFGHAHPSHSVRYGGAGLGLAVVRRLAEAMSGTVTVNDAPGGGALFVFEAEFPSIDDTARALVVSDQSIIVASPSRDVRDAAELQINGCCGDTQTVETLEPALEAGEDAVVLIDHAFSGSEQLLAKPRTRKALILLTPDERGLIEKYRLIGYAGYLIKPLRRSSVAARIAAITGRENTETATRSEDERIAPGMAPGARVLLVEDNPVNALLAQALLKREGCAVERAGTGEEALTALARTGFDIVLMDVRMPGMGGLAATRALRARGDETPIVALTATAFEEDRRAALDSGMNDFLSKPFEAATLRALLTRWTKRDHRVKLAS
jgi:CheY-like chemotaxis protein